MKNQEADGVAPQRHPDQLFQPSEFPVNLCKWRRHGVAPAQRKTYPM